MASVLKQSAASGCSENTFGPASCYREFDFTLTFEQAVLSIIPSAVLLLITPLRLLYLSTKPPTTVCGQNAIFKFIAAAFNVAFQLALVVLWSSLPFEKVRTSVPSASLCLANSVMILCLSYAEDKRSTRPSTLLNVYLLFSVLFDVTQDRTLWLTGRTDIAAVMSASIGIRIVMLCLEARSKSSYLKSPYKDLPPEATSGILNLSFVWWLNGLFATGFQKLLTMDDLSELDPALSSEALGKKMQAIWDKRGIPEGRLTLPTTVIYAFRWNLLAVVIPRLFMIGFTFAQPFLISASINYVERSGADSSRDHGYGLLAAAFLVYFGIAASTVHFKQSFNRFVTMFRGAMISLLYHRSMTLQGGVCTESAALTLMSTDVDNIIELLENINDVWARSVEIAVGTWLLERQLGAICVVPLIVSLVCSVGQSRIAKSIGQDQSHWNAAIQGRVKDTSSMLGSMKAVKISGLSHTVAATVQREREHELQTSRRFFTGIMWLNGLAFLPMTWSPVISFIVFAIQAKIHSTGSLTIVQAFTSLSIITLVTLPASKLLVLLPQVAASLGCFQRIQTYLVSDTWEDSRIMSPPDVSTPRYSQDEKKPECHQVVNNLPKSSGPMVAIEFLNATIHPGPRAAAAAIADVSFTVETGSFTVLVGPVGSGKTTILNAMLGELRCESGSIFVASKRMAFCRQSPWLLNVSIRECITGMSQADVDEEWYRTVVYACALEEDIQQWPEGDRSIIGSQGLTLSGGQKQRVALARAVFSRQDIILMDDIFSALDVKTQDVIIDRLLSWEGIFREIGTTMILATHSARCLHLTDKIIVLHSTGRIEMQTSYDNLRQDSKLADIIPLQESDNPNVGRDSRAEDAEERPTEGVAHETGVDELMDVTRRTGDFSIYWYYIQTVRPALWVAFLVILPMAAFTDNFPQVWLEWWASDRVRGLPLNLSVYAAFALSSSILSVMCIHIVFLNIMPQAATRLHKKLLDTVMNAPQAFFASTDTGVTLNRFSQDMSLVDMALPGALLSVTMAFFNCIAQLGLIATGSSYMAITIPFALGVIWAIQHVYLKTSRQLRYLDLESKSPLYSHFIETLDGLSTIRALGWQILASDLQAKRLDRSQRPYYMLLSVQRWLNLVLDLIVTALAVIVVGLATQLRGSTSGGLLGIALNNILGVNKSLSDLVTYWTSLETSLGAIARVKSFSESTPSEDQPHVNHALSQAWPETGEIQLSRVSVVHHNGAQGLEGVSLTISPGQKLGICGRTGSGKSSLILALLRLVDVSSGSIVIDGQNITAVPCEDIRQRLIAIPQDPFILPGSVRFNADPLDLSTDEEITSVLRRVGIWAALEDRGGLDGVLIDQPLSHGQQQLFCLARAIIRKNKNPSTVLIMDEATSSVDRDTDRLMQRLVKEEFGKHTIISVAHRLETIMDSDKIAVLDAGKLVELDNPQALLARDSHFRRLWQLQ